MAEEGTLLPDDGGGGHDAAVNPSLDRYEKRTDGGAADGGRSDDTVARAEEGKRTRSPCVRTMNTTDEVLLLVLDSGANVRRQFLFRLTGFRCFDPTSMQVGNQNE